MKRFLIVYFFHLKNWLKDQLYRPLSIKKYWESLEFSYLETYSGLEVGEDDIEVGEDYMVDPVNYLLFHECKFHKSAKKTNSFEFNSAFVTELKKILSIPFKKSLTTLCVPVYRDAIVFYSDKDEIISVLQICFSCHHLITEKREWIKADDRVFFELSELMKKHGHLIKN